MEANLKISVSAALATFATALAKLDRAPKTAMKPKR
jgi:hypothetical protein